MKKLFLLFAIMISSYCSFAQLQYPFPQSGTEVVVIETEAPMNGGYDNNISYRYSNDTIMCGNTYSKFIFTQPQLPSTFYTRYDNGKIYHRYSCAKQEYLIFDFSLNTGDTTTVYVNGFGYVRSYKVKVKNVSSITLLNGQKRKYIEVTLNNDFDENWIEGIGCIHGGILYYNDAPLDGGSNSLVNAKDASGLLYEVNPPYFDYDALLAGKSADYAAKNRKICKGDTIGIKINGFNMWDSNIWSSDPVGFTCGDGTPMGNCSGAVVSPNVDTKYIITTTHTDPIIYTTTDTIKVIVNPHLTIVDANKTPISDTISVCQNSYVSLTARGAKTYTVTPKTGFKIKSYTDSSVVFSPLVSQIYTITGTDNNGCTGTIKKTILKKNIAVADAGLNKTISSGQSTKIGSAAYNVALNYSWSSTPASSVSSTWQPTVSPTVTTTYSVTVTSPNGCKNTDSVIITVP